MGLVRQREGFDSCLSWGLRIARDEGDSRFGSQIFKLQIFKETSLGFATGRCHLRCFLGRLRVVRRDSGSRSSLVSKLKGCFLSGTREVEQQRHPSLHNNLQ